jgi:hypothetical protein
MLKITSRKNKDSLLLFCGKTEPKEHSYVLSKKWGLS